MKNCLIKVDEIEGKARRENGDRRFITRGWQATIIDSETKKPLWRCSIAPTEYIATTAARAWLRANEHALLVAS